MQRRVSVGGGSGSEMSSQATPKKAIFLSTRDARCLDGDDVALDSNGAFASSKTLVGSRGEKAGSVGSESELCSPTSRV